MCVSRVSIEIDWKLHLLPAVYQEAYAIGKQPGDDAPTDVREPGRDRFWEDAQI